MYPPRGIGADFLLVDLRFFLYNKKDRKGCEPMIRLAVFDIDRTLIPSKLGQIAQETAAAIRQLQSRGIRTAIASGRMGHLIPDELRALEFDYYILSNGAYVTDGKGTVLCQESIDPALSEALIQELCRRGLAADVRYVGGMLPGNPNRDVREAMQEFWAQKGVKFRPPTRDFQWHIAPPEGQQPISFDACIPVEQQKDMMEMFPQLDFLSVFEGPMCDINPKGVSKATGIRRICGLMGIPMEDSIAFGDDRNDLEMVAEAGIGVAMGNAIDMVKNAADYVTDSCENLGVVKALRHFKIIE